MRHLSSLMQHEVVLALGWTLIHSLWQGLLLAIITGIMLLATRKSESQKRYELLTGLFLLFIAVTGITFARELYLAVAHPGFRPLANIAAGKSVISTIIPFTDSHIVVNRSWASRLKEYFNQHAYLIVTIWFIIFIARFIKLVGEVAYIQRLKTYRTSEPPQAWKTRLKELMEKMSISTYVQFLESGIVKVPVVMGMLKPVILLPLGLLSQLPPDEIEAILLHELAHIRRRDYFVNLVQSFAETLFFFNPALMWLSSLIREERENCCDDIAISVTNNQTKFIDALISFQELNLSKSSFTMGFPGRKHQLLNRVKRIISKRNKTLNTTEKSILTLSMAILIMLSFVAAKNIPVSKIRQKLSFTNASSTLSSVDKPEEKVTETIAAREKAETVNTLSTALLYIPAMHESIDTVPAQQKSAMSSIYQLTGDSAAGFKNYMTDISDDGTTRTMTIFARQRNNTQYRLKKVNGQVTELDINGKSIPESEFKSYQETIDLIERPYEVNKTRTEQEKERSRIQQEMDRNRQKIAEINNQLENAKRDGTPRSSSPKRVLVNGRWVMENADSVTKQEYLQKQLELKIKLAELEKTNSEDPDVSAKKLNLKMVEPDKNNSKQIDIKTKKLSSLNADLKVLKLKLIELDSVKSAKKDTLYKVPTFNTASKTLALQKIDLKRKSQTVHLKQKADSLRQALRITEQQLSQAQKLQSMNDRNARDDGRVQMQAAQIRNIISDLEKENVKVDVQKSWFALDENRFIVNGKSMSPELHRRFKAKYLKPRITPGYFYGPVQLEGKGVFLDYRDLSR